MTVRCVRLVLVMLFGLRCLVCLVCVGWGFVVGRLRVWFVFRCLVMVAASLWLRAA